MIYLPEHTAQQHITAAEMLLDRAERQNNPEWAGAFSLMASIHLEVTKAIRNEQRFS